MFRASAHKSMVRGALAERPSGRLHQGASGAEWPSSTGAPPAAPTPCEAGHPELVDLAHSCQADKRVAMRSESAVPLRLLGQKLSQQFPLRRKRWLDHGSLCMAVNKRAHGQRPLFRQNSETQSVASSPAAPYSRQIC
jgi:hypothetical protein